MREKDLNRWLDAGLIDEATFENIRAYEAEHARPIAMWAITGLGALAIGLGIISVIAANWEDVPGMVRLALHLCVMAGLSFFIALKGDDLAKYSPWQAEACIFVLTLLGMGFFGHIGQVYQTDSPLWRPLAAWLVLFAPLLMLRGQSWLSAFLLVGISVYASYEYYDASVGKSALAELGNAQNNGSTDIWASIVTALPLFYAPLAALMRRYSYRENYWRRLEQIALIFALIWASVFNIVGSLTSELGGGGSSDLIRLTIACLAGLLVVILRQGNSAKASALVLVICGITAMLSPYAGGSAIGAAFLFFSLWGSVAWGAIYSGGRKVFQMAVAVIAFRLIVLSFELGGSLLTNGLGFIIMGALTIGIAKVAHIVSREYAPEANAHDGDGA